MSESPTLPASSQTRALLGGDQRARKNDLNRQKKEELDDEINTWMDSSLALADSLSQKYGKKRQYYLNIMFNNNLLQHKMGVTNPWIAWSWKMAQNLKETLGASVLCVLFSLHIHRRCVSLDSGQFDDTMASSRGPGDGNVLGLPALIQAQKARSHEYHALSEEAKMMLVEEYEQEHDYNKFIKRDTQRSMTQFVLNICEKVEELVNFFFEVQCDAHLKVASLVQ